MKVSVDVLRRYTALPVDTRAETLLDDVGVEVKRVEQHRKRAPCSRSSSSRTAATTIRTKDRPRESGRTGATVLSPGHRGAHDWRESRALEVRVGAVSRLHRDASRTAQRGLVRWADAPPAHRGGHPLGQRRRRRHQPDEPRARPADARVRRGHDRGAITVRTSRTGERAWTLFTRRAPRDPGGHARDRRRREDPRASPA